MWDVTVWDRGICQVIGRSVRARVMFLENETGGGALKLVQLLPLYDHEAGHTSSLSRQIGNGGIRVIWKLHLKYQTLAELTISSKGKA